MKPARIMLWIGLMILALAIILTGGWCALAIWYRLPGGVTLRDVTTGLAIAIVMAANILIWTQLRWPAIGGYAILVGVVCLWWSTLTPSGHRNWMPDVARNLTGSIDGDQLTVQNVRNFNWRSDTDFDPTWETRSYHLSDVRNVDLIMSYWSGEAIAHTIVSFGFKDGQRLDFSIETRKAQARSLLVAYIAEANALALRPRFYNTATANCTTLVYELVKKIQPGVHWDPRILISGYLPEYLYSLGALDTRIPFNQLRELAKIHARALHAGDDPNFAAEIRVGIPTPQYQPAS